MYENPRHPQMPTHSQLLSTPVLIDLAHQLSVTMSLRPEVKIIVQIFLLLYF